MRGVASVISGDGQVFVGIGAWECGGEGVVVGEDGEAVSWMGGM